MPEHPASDDVPDDPLSGRGPGGTFAIEIHPRSTSLTVVEVAGDLDFVVAPTLRERLTARVDGVVGVLVVDLTRVTLMSAAAIAALVDVVTVAEARHVEVRVVTAARAVLNPLRITGVDRRLRIFPSLSGATLRS